MDAEKVLARSELDTWLESHHAKRIIRYNGGPHGMVVDYMLMGRGTMFVLRWPDGSFNIFTPSEDLSIGVAMHDAEVRVGLREEALTRQNKLVNELELTERDRDELLAAMNVIRVCYRLPDDVTPAELARKVKEEADGYETKYDGLLSESERIADLLGIDTENASEYDLVDEVRKLRRDRDKWQQNAGLFKRQREANIATTIRHVLEDHAGCALDDEDDMTRLREALIAEVAKELL